MIAVEAQALTRRLGRRLVLDRFDLAVSSGEAIAVLGANGAGKTTLLRCLAGCLRPTSGDVLWFGRSPTGQPFARRQVGFAGHESLVYSELSARDNLLFAARMYGCDAPVRVTESLLDRVGLVGRATQPAGQLSKGQRQRLSLARAVVHDPPIVILDEPFTGLDAGGRDWLAEWLAEFRAEGRTVMFTGHDVPQCERMADRCVSLQRAI